MNTIKMFHAHAYVKLPQQGFGAFKNVFNYFSFSIYSSIYNLFSPFFSAVKDVSDQTYANKFTVLHKVHSC